MPPFAKSIVDHGNHHHHHHHQYPSSSIGSNSVTVISSSRMSSSRNSKNNKGNNNSLLLFRRRFSRSNSSSSVTSSSSSSTSSSTSTSTSTSTSAPSSSSSSSVPSHFKEALALQGSLSAILLCLERNGVSHASVQELLHMYQADDYFVFMARAEEYVDCLLPTLCLHNNTTALDDLETVLTLFVGAWRSLVHYARCLYKHAYQDFMRHETKQWEECIVQQTMTAKQQLLRRQRRLEEWDPRVPQQLKGRLATLIRFKIDCEKGFALTTEWSRYLRAQQHALLRNSNNKNSNENNSNKGQS